MYNESINPNADLTKIYPQEQSSIINVIDGNTVNNNLDIGSNKSDQSDCSVESYTSMNDSINLNIDENIKTHRIYRNLCVPLLYQHALIYEENTLITSTGALCCMSGDRTGRCPFDKRTVLDPSTRDKVWWDDVNIPLEDSSFLKNKNIALDFINSRDRVYITDAYAGWDNEHRLNIRIITTRAYHALFMNNLLIVPTKHELENFVPQFIIYNAGAQSASTDVEGVTSNTSICLSYSRMEMVILGTEYAGEMKKGILTLMMYLLPQKLVLPLHSSCNIGLDGSVTLFFGLSGTGKTTLSTEPNRRLIGDDEHAWTDNGIFNIEGGCYAKCKGLTRDNEPEIYDSIRFGTVLENVICDELTHEVNFNNCDITENIRCAYPLNYINNSLIPAVINTHPNNIIFLTCDAFGALPPISKLNISQALYHFVSGYTTKMIGTEIGISKPTATFSSCYAGPFLAMHPLIYANLLKDKLLKYKSNVWLLNTGWIKGSCDSEDGIRIPLKYTRQMIEAIHNNLLDDVEYEEVPIFKFMAPKTITGIPVDILHQKYSWKNENDYLKQLEKVAIKFIDNFKQFSNHHDDFITQGGPSLG